MHTKGKHTTENHTKIKHTKEKHCTGYLFDFVRTKKDDHLHHEYVSQVVDGDNKNLSPEQYLTAPTSFAFIPHYLFPPLPPRRYIPNVVVSPPTCPMSKCNKTHKSTTRTNKTYIDLNSSIPTSSTHSATHTSTTMLLLLLQLGVQNLLNHLLGKLRTLLVRVGNVHCSYSRIIGIRHLWNLDIGTGTFLNGANLSTTLSND
mmetsp:Transcript_148/g.198  ORF Transcript_148/g.198 Transcript_148/m.198 type:complete len:202 (-) Transcript_148:1278-1883(-)